MAVEMASQVASSIGVLLEDPNFAFALGGMGRMIYAALMLACVSVMVGRKVPMMLILCSITWYLSVGILVAFTGELTLVHWLGAELPKVVLFMMGVGMLVEGRQGKSLGIIWLAGLLVVHVGLKLALPFIEIESTIFMLTYFYDSVVLLMIGAVLVMVSSEWMSRSLVSQDVRLKEYELENRRLEQQFAQAQKFEGLGVMAGGIAHDFNNMLTSIMGYANLAMRKLPADSDVRKDLYMVMSGARQAVDLTSQMLLYTGKELGVYGPIDMSALVESMWSFINSIVPRKIRVVQKMARDLPVISGDQAQLGQVFVNLVANGINGIGKTTGQIEISTGAVEADQNFLDKCFFTKNLPTGSYVYVCIEDSGGGIDPRQIERIFDPLHLDVKFSDKAARNSLGLSSLAGIVRQHRGFIQVTANKEEGTMFTAYFPTPALSHKSSDRESAVPRSNMPNVINEGKVLLADDDSRIRSLISSILVSDGFEVSVAEDDEEAAFKIDKEGGKFSLFVLDCTMPKMSGTEVYQRIRSRGLLAPVILISGYHQEQVVNNIRNDPDAYFIKKPFNVDDLLGQVNAAVVASG
jgi:signal transduction histidine kinase/CheY-like chemotaxis protein